MTNTNYRRCELRYEQGEGRGGGARRRRPAETRRMRRQGRNADAVRAAPGRSAAVRRVAAQGSDGSVRCRTGHVSRRVANGGAAPGTVLGEDLDLLDRAEQDHRPLPEKR